jgi:uncharacterized hydrophobic protein (TIGR00271 family)
MWPIGYLWCTTEPAYMWQGLSVLSHPPADIAALTEEFEKESKLDEVYIVLSIGAGLIASLGLVADSPAVVIGAMLVAPWILPLRAVAFGILQGRLPLVVSALFTLATGVLLTIGLSYGLGLSVGLPVFGAEVLSRTTPNLLDLGVALVAGAISTYAKVRSKAVSSVAGTAIAVALVPPVCVCGLLLSAQQWGPARGAGLLFLANLLGILSGGLLTLAAAEPLFRLQLWRSRLGAVSLLLTALLLVPLSGSFLNLVGIAKQRSALQQVEQAIADSLRAKTLVLGTNAQLLGVNIDWAQNPPLIRASVSVTNPNLPTPRQVAAVQDFINTRQPIRYRLLVQRASIDVIGPQTAPNPPEVQEQLLENPRIAEAVRSDAAPAPAPVVPPAG